MLFRSLSIRGKIGYLPETPPLYTDMSVKDYLRFTAEIKDVPVNRQRVRVDKVLEECQLTGVKAVIIGTLSKGYRQRVGIAQAIIHEPKILILDEPTSGLDPIQILEVRDLIRSLGGRHTVILSSHLLPEVAMTCTKAIVLNEGRLVDYDTLDGLIARHLPGRKVTLDDIAFLEEIFGKLVTPA